MAETDDTEFAGDVTGRLSTSGPRGTFSGTLVGQTEIVWAVRPGRVVAADTHLVWTLGGSDRVTLDTRVRSR